MFIYCDVPELIFRPLTIISFHDGQINVFIVLREYETFRDSLFKDTIGESLIFVKNEPGSVWKAVLPVTFIYNFFTLTSIPSNISDAFAIAIRPVVFPFTFESYCSVPLAWIKLFEAKGHQTNENSLAVCLASFHFPFVHTSRIINHQSFPICFAVSEAAIYPETFGGQVFAFFRRSWPKFSDTRKWLAIANDLLFLKRYEFVRAYHGM